MARTKITREGPTRARGYLDGKLRYALSTGECTQWVVKMFDDCGRVTDVGYPETRSEGLRMIENSLSYDLELEEE